jgi:curved DNA-binding protein
MTLEELCETSSKLISYQLDGKQETVSVKVPAGIPSGKKLRLRGKGHPSPHHGPSGDLFIQIKVLEHPVFRRDGGDLYFKKPIPFSNAVLGGDVEVSTLDNKTLKLKIPPGTQAGTKLRLKGHGLPHMNGDGRGDAYAEITILVPKKLSKEQKSLVKSLKESGL